MTTTDRMAHALTEATDVAALMRLRRDSDAIRNDALASMGELTALLARKGTPTHAVHSGIATAMLALLQLAADYDMPASGSALQSSVKRAWEEM